MHDEREFIRTCRKIGKDRQLVQAGGGNISVKLNSSLMLIKSSGISLADVSKKNGHCVVNYKLIADHIKSAKLNFSTKAEESYNAALSKSVVYNKSCRPSMEAGFHALLGKAVIHTHPIPINAILCSRNGKKVMESIIGRDKFLWIPYKTPGLELSKEIFFRVKKHTDNNPNNPVKILFLENHGLIVCGKSLHECMLGIKKIIGLVESYFKSAKIRMYKYENFKIEDLSYKKFKGNLVKIFMENQNYRGMLGNHIFPDSIVYCSCGFSFNKADALKIALYNDGSVVLPKKSIVKPSKMMEILIAWICVLLLMGQFGKPRYLSEQEYNRILGMESEKYRQRSS